MKVRKSPETESNPELKKIELKEVRNNRDFLDRSDGRGGVLLIGGSSVLDCRVRFAQSRLRQDLLPSYWSTVGILKDEGLFTVPLTTIINSKDAATTNGVTTQKIAAYSDPKKYPNMALLQFANDMGPILEKIEQIKTDRNDIDLPSLMIPWLCFVWATADSPNPLTQSRGLPSAAFVETAHAMAGVDMTPNVSSASSCPEAIWQSAKWWYGYHGKVQEQVAKLGPNVTTADDDKALTIPPRGIYVIRQSSAAVLEDKP